MRFALLVHVGEQLSKSFRIWKRHSHLDELHDQEICVRGGVFAPAMNPRHEFWTNPPNNLQ